MRKLRGLKHGAGRQIQRGQAILLIVILIAVGIGAALWSMMDLASVTRSNAGARHNEAVLAQAKAALVGYAAGADITGAGRPGDLPCPDIDNDGFAKVPQDYPCNGSALGRLPWKTLGLPDLRDSDGERLWYAVSSNFKSNPRTACAAPGDPGCLNSDSRGTITVRNRDGTVVNTGSNPDQWTPSGVIAVIIAPGRVLQRQGAASSQIRGCTIGVDCDATERCTATPPTSTPKCDPQNYLDVLSGTEDNLDFVDGDASNGFINGEVRDASGNVIVNDRIMTITYEDLMPMLQRRVAAEVLKCLNDYAAIAQNEDRFPWAAPVTTVTPPYADAYSTRFGRVPDTLFNTQHGLPGGVATPPCGNPSLCMTNAWPASCGIVQGTWWNNWKDMVFYGVAEAFQPADPVDLVSNGVPPSVGCGAAQCLKVDPPSTSYNKRVAVVVAGKRLYFSTDPPGPLGGQFRATSAQKANIDNYLEDTNRNGPTSIIYTQQPTSAIFNDFVLFR